MYPVALRSGLLVLGLSGALCFPAPVTGAEFAAERARMIEEIERTVDETRYATGVTALGPELRQSLWRVPRHEFVPPDLIPAAYANRPLPVGYGQTISQPYIVALMTELLGVDADSVVLEVGTGSGYQAAVLAGMVHHVYTIEIIEPLGEQARARLQRLGYRNVDVRVGDGYYGWEEHAPYDAIIVTAAGSHVPPPLVAQLKPGGSLIIPVGARFTVQQLLLVGKDSAGTPDVRQILPVRFVPLTGGH